MEGVGKGKTQKDHSIDCAAIWGRGRHKAKRVDLRELGMDGRPGKERKWAIH